jgi:hypothetical protein
VYARLNPDAIDFFNVQFYNQGLTSRGTVYYTDYSGLILESDPPATLGENLPQATFPGTALAEIASYGIPFYKLVVGKYMQTTDAENGFVDPFELGQFLGSAQISFPGYPASVMTWQWPGIAGGGDGKVTAGNWIQQVQRGIANVAGGADGKVTAGNGI